MPGAATEPAHRCTDGGSPDLEPNASLPEQPPPLSASVGSDEIVDRNGIYVYDFLGEFQSRHSRSSAVASDLYVHRSPGPIEGYHPAWLGRLAKLVEMEGAHFFSKLATLEITLTARFNGISRLHSQFDGPLRVIDQSQYDDVLNAALALKPSVDLKQ